MSHLIKNPPATGRLGFNPWAGKIPWRRERLPTLVFWPGEFHGLTVHGGHESTIKKKEKISKKVREK